MRFPKLAVVNALNALPNLRLAAALVPPGAEMPVIKAKHLRSKPGGNVDPIGDVADGNVVFRFSPKQSRPHRAGYLAMQRGDCVCALRQSEGKHGHAKQFVGIIGILTSQPEKAFRGKAE